MQTEEDVEYITPKTKEAVYRKVLGNILKSKKITFGEMIMNEKKWVPAPGG